MGVPPRLGTQPSFRRKWLDLAIRAQFAGEVRCGMRRIPGVMQPVRVLDMGFAFGTSFVLSLAVELLMAERIRVRHEDPEKTLRFVLMCARKLNRWLDGKGPPLTPRQWRRLARTFVLVLPDGDVLPHKVEDGREGWLLKIEPLNCAKPLPFNLADVLRAVCETGKVPTIIETVRFYPEGKVVLPDLELPDGSIVPPGEDPTKMLMAGKRRLDLRPDREEPEIARVRGLVKRLVQMGAWGLLVEVDEFAALDASEPSMVHYRFDDSVGDVSASIVERPGVYYFPVIGAAVTALARLLLALGALLVERRGGLVAYAHTDSLFIVSDTDGGIIPCPGGELRCSNGRPGIRALSWAEVERIRWRLEELSPVDEALRPHGYESVEVPGTDGESDLMWQARAMPGLFKLERENFLHENLFLKQGGSAASAQAYLHLLGPMAYCVYQQDPPTRHVEVGGDMPVVVDDGPGEIRVVKVSEHRLVHRAPDGAPNWITEGFEWLVKRDLGIATSEPWWFDEPAVFEMRATRIEDLRPFADVPGFRPWSRYLVLPTDSRDGAPLFAAPCEGVPIKDLEWRDETGILREVRFPGLRLSEDDLYSTSVRGRTMRQVFLKHARVHDPLGFDAKDNPCNHSTAGLIHRHPTTVLGVVVTGKETRDLDRVGILEPPQTTILDRDDELAIVRAVLNLYKKIPDRFWKIEAEELVSSSTLYRWCRGDALEPDRMIRIAASQARKDLLRAHPTTTPPEDDIQACALLLQEQHLLLPRCDSCGKRLSGRQRRWCDDCKKGKGRSRTRRSSNRTIEDRKEDHE